MSENIKVLVGTRKGAWTLKGNSDRNQWQVEGPLHLGSMVYHYTADPRKPDYLLLTESGGASWPKHFPFQKRRRDMDRGNDSTAISTNRR